MVQGNISYYGTAWVDVTDEPGDYTSYVVTIDSITLTRTDGYVADAAGTPEIVDLTQVHNIAELWSSGSIPDGTYTSATITMDYTPVASGGTSVISVMVNGKPQAATVLDAVTGAAPTTYSINIAIRSRQSADHHADLRVDERGAADRRFRSGGVRYRRSQHLSGDGQDQTLSYRSECKRRTPSSSVFAAL